MSFKETAIAKLNEMKSGAHGVIKSTIADCITTLKWIPDDTEVQLSQFKKAKSEGRLLILPCKIGDLVFVVGSKIRAGSLEAWVNSGRFRLTDLPKVGTTIFLTREEAEAAMKEILNG